MVTAWYPINKAKDVIKAFRNAPKLPDFIKKWETFATPDGNNGIKVYNLVKIKENVSDDAVMAIGKMQYHFTNEVDGYTWKVEICTGMRDGMKMLGV